MAFDAGQAQNILNKIGQTSHVAVDLFKETHIGDRIFHGAAKQRLDVALDRGQWRLQLMGNICHEVAADTFKAADIGDVMKDNNDTIGSRLAA